MKLMPKNAVSYFLCVMLLFVPTIFLSAQEVTCNGSEKICNPIGTDTLNEFLKVLLEGVVKLGIPIIALAIIYSGFLFVSAQGNSEKLQKAKDAFFFTLIGAAILLGSWAIAKLISETV